MLSKNGINKLTNEQKFHFITLHGFKCMIIFKSGEGYLKAISSMRDMVKMIEKTLGLEQDFQNFYFSSGLFHYYVSKARQQYPVAKAAMFGFPPSDKEKGINSCTN